MQLRTIKTQNKNQSPVIRHEILNAVWSVINKTGCSANIQVEDSNDSTAYKITFLNTTK
jgi:hypothetical protein